MNKKVIVSFIFFIFALLTLSQEPVHANEEVLKTDPNINTLVIFTSENGELDEHQRLLDLSLGHFTENITYKSSEEVTPKDLEGQTHLVYYGQVKETLSPNLSQIISSFEGPTMALGHNVEQLGEAYSYLQAGGEKVITKIDYIGDEEKSREIEPNLILETTLIEIRIKGRQNRV